MNRSFKRLASHVVRWVEQHYALFVCGMLGILVLNELWLFGPDLRQWDVLLVSGVITFVIGLRVALRIPHQAAATLTRLVDRGVLSLSPQQLTHVQEDLETRADAWAHRGGIFVGIALLIAFIVAFGQELVGHIDLTVVEVLGGYIVGRYLGRMACYGRLGWLLQRQNIILKVQPGHIDGVAGLKPVGDFYFAQAMVIAIPALYLAVWWFIIPLIGQYRNWREPYLGLLVIVLTVEVLAFLLPLWSFHEAMHAQKALLLGDADKLSRAIATAQTALSAAQADQERTALKNRIADMTEQYWAIEQLPTWPVAPAVRRRFTFNNLALFLPIISQSIRVSGVWQTILEDLQRILTGLST
jgi:hypothetical protein